MIEKKRIYQRKRYEMQWEKGKAAGIDGILAKTWRFGSLAVRERERGEV